MVFSRLDRLILRLTRKTWNKYALEVLSFHMQQGWEHNAISSDQFHELHARFDPTQSKSHLVIEDVNSYFPEQLADNTITVMEVRGDN